MNELDPDGLQDMDYDVMKQVIQGEGKLEVWTIINAYNETAFRERIQLRSTKSWFRILWLGFSSEINHYLYPSRFRHFVSSFLRLTTE